MEVVSIPILTRKAASREVQRFHNLLHGTKSQPLVDSSRWRTPFILIELRLPIPEKLTKNNLQVWKLQVLAIIRGTQLEGYLDGSTAPPPKEVNVKEGDKVVNGVNPKYTKWVALDQQLLSYLLTTMTRDVMLQVSTATTSAQLWTTVKEIFSSKTRTRSINMRIALATLKKGNLSATDYVGKMKALVDEMAAAVNPSAMKNSLGIS